MDSAREIVHQASGCNPLPNELYGGTGFVEIESFNPLSRDWTFTAHTRPVQANPRASTRNLVDEGSSCDRVVLRQAKASSS